MKKAFLPILLALLNVFPLPCHADLWGNALTTAEEKELGKEFMLYVKKNLELVEDASIRDYVTKVGQRIVAQYPEPIFPFTFDVVNEDVYNAFAGPAGHIFINSGLLAAMENEDQLAGILGHEIAHVFGRHISERIEQSTKIGLATMAGILAGVFLGGKGAGALTATSLAVGESFSLQYSREHEIEADQVGLKYLVKAGYGGEGLLHVLQKIREKQWFGSQQIPSYLQTHPAVEGRLAYLDTWIQAHPQWRNIPQSKKEGDFDMIRAKLIALYKDPAIARPTFDAAIRENPEQAAALYGKAILLNREGDRNGAKDYLLKSIALRPFDGDVLRELGKIYFDMGSYTETIKVLRGALTLKSNDTESRFLLGQAQMKTGDLHGAVETLQALLRDAPDHLPALYTLGVAQGELKNFLDAHFNLGMYYKQRGEMETARFHLGKALDLCQGDPGKKEEIQKALKELPKPDKSPLKGGMGISPMDFKGGMRTPEKIYQKQRTSP